MRIKWSSPNFSATLTAAWLAFLSISTVGAMAQYRRTPGELITPNKLIYALSKDEQETATRALVHNDEKPGIDDLLRARNRRIRDEINDPQSYLSGSDQLPVDYGWGTFVLSPFATWTNPHYLILRTGAMAWASGIPTPMRPVMAGEPCQTRADRFMEWVHSKRHVDRGPCGWEAPIPVELTLVEAARVRNAVSMDRYYRWQDRIDMPTVVADASDNLIGLGKPNVEDVDPETRAKGEQEDKVLNDKAIALYDHFLSWSAKPKTLTRDQIAQLPKPPPLGKDAQWLLVTDMSQQPPKALHQQGPMSPADCAAQAAKQVAAGNTAACQAVIAR